MRREGKAGPFIPSEVRAYTRPARATTPTVARRRRRATRAVGARAKRLRSGGNAYARERTHARRRQFLRPCDDGCRVEGVFFHKHPKLQRSGDDICVRATTSACARATTRALVQRRVPNGRDVSSQTPQTSALGRRRLRPGDNACVRATTSALAPRRLDPGFETFAFFHALAIQTKLFHYLFLKITGTVLKMVIQSYSY